MVKRATLAIVSARMFLALILRVSSTTSLVTTLVWPALWTVVFGSSFQMIFSLITSMVSLGLWTGVVLLTVLSLSLTELIPSPLLALSSIVDWFNKLELLPTEGLAVWLLAGLLTGWLLTGALLVLLAVGAWLWTRFGAVVLAVVGAGAVLLLV